jgi:uncharacterized membrane protein
MATILRFLQSIALVTWVGGIFFLAAIAAPAAFTMLSTRGEAGAVVGYMLGKLHVLGYVAGAVYLVCAVALAKSSVALLKPAALLVIGMLLLTAVNQHGVAPQLADLRAQMASEFGNVDQTPKENPLRAEFGKLHGVSTIVELVVLLLGLAALFLTLKSGQG